VRSPSIILAALGIRKGAPTPFRSKSAAGIIGTIFSLHFIRMEVNEVLIRDPFAHNPPFLIWSRRIQKPDPVLWLSLRAASLLYLGDRPDQLRIWIQNIDFGELGMPETCDDFIVNQIIIGRHRRVAHAIGGELELVVGWDWMVHNRGADVVGHEPSAKLLYDIEIGFSLAVNICVGVGKLVRFRRCLSHRCGYPESVFPNGISGTK
jgi:hypothetical protein